MRASTRGVPMHACLIPALTCCTYLPYLTYTRTGCCRDHAVFTLHHYHLTQLETSYEGSAMVKR
jgi:hypothetical protein